MLPFGYAQASGLSQAIAYAGSHEQAMFIAGGTDMLQLLQETVVRPRTLVDINALPLAGIDMTGEGMRIGAVTRLADVADDERIRRYYPLLAQALLETASPQVRNMATVGGNLLQRTRCLYFRDANAACNKQLPGSGCSAMDGEHRMNAILGGSEHCFAAYPGDMAVALLAMDAEIEVQGAEGERRMTLASLHRPPGDQPQSETNLSRGEIITAVLLPDADFRTNAHFLKVRDRASFEWALVSVAACFAMDGALIRRANVAVGGVATTPWRLSHIEHLLTGQTLSESLAVSVGKAAADGAQPRPGNSFKLALLQTAVERAIRTAGGLS